MSPRTSGRSYPYPVALRQLDNFRDSSWGNDVTDSLTFSIGDIGYVLWVEPIARDERSTEFPDPPRYSLCRLERASKLRDSLDDRQVEDETWSGERDAELLAVILSLGARIGPRFTVEVAANAESPWLKVYEFTSRSIAEFSAREQASYGHRVRFTRIDGALEVVEFCI